jgi:membrane protease YdiL (CAAX protease family)
VDPRPETRAPDRVAAARDAPPCRRDAAASRRGALREVAWVFLVVAALTVGITRLRAVAPLAEYVHLAVGALFLFVALRRAERDPGGAARFGIDLAGVLAPPPDGPEPEPADAEAGVGAAGPPGGGMLGRAPRRAPSRSVVVELGRTVRDALPSALRETAVALAVIAVVFPPFALGFWLWHAPAQAFAWRPAPDLGSFALTQLVVVALPEEAFFRGFVQTRLTDALPARRALGPVPLAPAALVLQAALFGLIHFAVDLSPERLAVAFPGLLFGVLRAWRGGIGAAMLVHAASNVYADFLVRGWLA